MFLGKNFKLTKKDQKRRIVRKLLRERKRREELARKRGTVYTKGLNPINKNKKVLIFSEPRMRERRINTSQYKQKYVKGLMPWYAKDQSMVGFHLQPVSKRGRKGKKVKRNSDGFLG